MRQPFAKDVRKLLRHIVLDPCVCYKNLEPRAEAIDVIFDAGREISIGGGRQASRDASHHRHHDVGQRDLPEAHLGRDFPDAPLVIREYEGVKQNDGDRGNARRLKIAQLTSEVGLVDASPDLHGFSRDPDDRLRGCGKLTRFLAEDNSLVDFDDAFVEDVRSADFQVENLGASLIADEQQVLETWILIIKGIFVIDRGELLDCLSMVVIIVVVTAYFNKVVVVWR